MLTLITFSVSFCIFGTVGETKAQVSTGDQFQTFTSSANGFKILYPSNWDVEETDLTSSDDVVHFRSPDRSSLTVNVKSASPYLDTDSMTLKNKTAEQYALERLSVASVMGQPDSNVVYKEIRSNEFPIAGRDGWKIEYIWGYIVEGYWLEVFITANDNLYTIQYNSLPLNVPKTLPQVEKMIESFQIIG
jgi:hypothetical protein